MKITSEQIAIRNFLPNDFSALADYWTNKSAEYWASLGVDKSKMKSREQFLDFFNETYAKLGDVPTVGVIELSGKAIGVHTLTELKEGVSAVMHSHIFEPEFQRKGISFFSYPKAMKHFFNKFKLEKILFKTPKLNVGANKAKQKLGIPILGETTFESPISLGVIPAYLYEVDLELVEKLLQKIGEQT